ncbi:MAG: hypothetical protein Q7T11_05425 [Deltaproteobacteria bacterium]|nr:hypothetical protein [Deltaproteobacteria bacterium]
MVDRIDKPSNLEPWRVQDPGSAKKDSGAGGEQDGSKDAFAALHDKTDWRLLFEKSRLWKQNIQIGRDEIAEVLFQKINLKTDPSLLRVDILLKAGGKISPAFVSISRALGFKIKQLNPGDPIPANIILRDNFLRITVPVDPKIFSGEVKAAPPPSQREVEETTITKSLLQFDLSLRDPETGKLRAEVMIIYGVALFALTFIIGGIILF